MKLGACLVSAALACLSTAVSAFVTNNALPSARLTQQATATTKRPHSCRTLEMKKGAGKSKGMSPGNMGAGMSNIQRAEQAMAAQRNANPNVPVFEIFCRVKNIDIWYPAGSLAGDDRSKATMDALANGFLTGMYQGALQKGVADSVLSGAARNNLKQNIVRLFPQLSRNLNALEYGYKVRYPPYEVKKGEMPITLLTEEMKLSAFDKIKRNFGLGGDKKKK